MRLSGYSDMDSCSIFLQIFRNQAFGNPSICRGIEKETLLRFSNEPIFNPNDM